MANILKKLLQSVLRIPEGAGALPDAPPDPTKRNLLKGGAALGALSAIPVGKKVVPKIVEEFSTPSVKMDLGDISNIMSEVEIRKGSDVFKNLDQELDFGKDLYKSILGKNISKKEVLERDLADRLHWMKTGDSYGEDARSIGEYRITDLFEIDGGPNDPGPLGLSPYDFANQPEVLKTLEKHMGKADSYAYGGPIGDDLTEKALKEEFGDKADDLTDDEIEEWLESKVGNTKYFKKLMKASED
jgi:hypothetical protein